MLGRSDSCLKRLIARGGCGSLVGGSREEKREGMEGTVNSLRMIGGWGEGMQRGWPRVSRKTEGDAHQTLPGPEGDLGKRKGEKRRYPDLGMPREADASVSHRGKGRRSWTTRGWHLRHLPWQAKGGDLWSVPVLGSEGGWQIQAAGAKTDPSNVVHGGKW